MNKRSKKAAKSNINTRKGTNVACPTHRQHLPRQKQENRRLNTPRAQCARGRAQVSAEKTKL
ncbi:hypothetical protein HanRHA438_Chr16g0788741 [Helianthus annuus]|nr:hypothetical protein HanRHA438_Chr16g0788741 [Helianthus annuus]